MTTVTDYANAQYNADSSVDLDILTDEYGWIPTTIIPDDNDQEPHVIQIKQWLVDNKGSIASYEPYVATQEELDQQANQVELKTLKDLDNKSIRDIRKWVSEQETAPQTVKDYEESAVAARGRLK
jgi:hypothetical protein